MSNSSVPLEQTILKAILSLGDDAYGVTIHRKATELSAPKDITPGAVYIALDRLEDRGLIASWLAAPTPDRGERSKRFYRLEALGERALVESDAKSKGLLQELLEALGDRTRRRPKWSPDRVG